MKKIMKRWADSLRVYLDDLLFLAGQALLLVAAYDLAERIGYGRPAALAFAGVLLIVDARIVARARGGDSR